MQGGCPAAWGRTRQGIDLKPAAFTILVFTATLFGANHVAARVAFDHGLGVSTAVTVRSLATAAVVGLLVWLQRVSLRMTRRQAQAMGAISLLVALQSLTLYASVARIPVGLALLTFNLYSITALLWSRVLYRGAVDLRVLRLMPFMFLGLALALDVLGSASGLGLQQQWAQIGSGVGYALAAAAAFGLVLALTQHEVAGLDGRARSFMTMLAVGLLALVATLAQGGLQWPEVEPGMPGWWGLALLALLYGSAFTILFTVLPRLGAVGSSPIMNIEPVMALFMAWAVLDQSMAPGQMAGALLVVGCVIGIGLMRRTA